MTTLLQEANAGAFTTKGQATDRRNELIEIDRRAFAQDYLKVLRPGDCNSRELGRLLGRQPYGAFKTKKTATR